MSHDQLVPHASDNPLLPRPSSDGQEPIRRHFAASARGRSRALPPGAASSYAYPPPRGPAPSAAYPQTGPRASTHSNHNPEVTEIVTLLRQHGCRDLTDSLYRESQFPISGGGLGDVYKALLGRLPVAVKTTRLHFINQEPRKYLRRAAKEIHTWSKCQHPNVHRLLGVAQFRGQLAMVSEWMPQGNVTGYLSTRPEVDRCLLCHGIAVGLAYLHRQGIIHGDLKGGNVLISSEGKPLLSDFGNAVLHEQSIQFTGTTTMGLMSLRWTAPEILSGTSSPSYAADVYALGMTWLEIITGKVPHHNLSNHAIPLAVANNKRIPDRPEMEIPRGSIHGDFLWDLLVQCWAYEPEQRPSASQAQDTIGTVQQDGLIKGAGETDVEPEFLATSQPNQLPTPLESNNSFTSTALVPRWELWHRSQNQNSREALSAWQAKSNAIVEWDKKFLRDIDGVVTCMVTPILTCRKCQILLDHIGQALIFPCDGPNHAQLVAEQESQKWVTKHKYEFVKCWPIRQPEDTSGRYLVSVCVCYKLNQVPIHECHGMGTDMAGAYAKAARNLLDGGHCMIQVQ